METVKEQITDFLNKCEEIKKCKFIMATTKIKDLLKSIVNSAELYELFNTVTAHFDYIAAKQRYFIESDNGVYGNSRVVLPDTIGDRLAFIFCLLVEFDRNDINFNLFLQKYYPKDGSYYASYHLFCDEVISGLEKIICDIYADELEKPSIPDSGRVNLLANLSAQPQTQPQPQPVQPQTKPQLDAPVPDPELVSLLSGVYMLIEGEISAVEESELNQDEKDAAYSMLGSLKEAVKAGDKEVIKSLTCGYNYFALCNKFVSGSLAEMFEAIGEYVTRL